MGMLGLGGAASGAAAAAKGAGKFSGLMDMIDGGGAGRGGQQFEGGGMSGIINELGVKPRGFDERMQANRPQARPTMSTNSQPAGVSMRAAPQTTLPQGPGIPRDPMTPQMPQDAVGAYGKTPIDPDDPQVLALIQQLKAAGII